MPRVVRRGIYYANYCKLGRVRACVRDLPRFPISPPFGCLWRRCTRRCNIPPCFSLPDGRSPGSCTCASPSRHAVAEHGGSCGDEGDSAFRALGFKDEGGGGLSGRPGNSSGSDVITRCIKRCLRGNFSVYPGNEFSVIERKKHGRKKKHNARTRFTEESIYRNK